jgi:hypothetical protein
MERPDGGSLADAAAASSEAPAPPDADVRGPVIACRLHRRECDHRRAGDSPPTLVLQPWTPRGAAATYVAWAVDDCAGHFGVFDSSGARVLLGEGTPAGRRWRPVVETGPATDHLAAATPDLRPSIPRARATTADGPILRPAPADAAETGETHVLSVESWTRPVTAYVQPWRPLNAGAAYVACRIDDPHDRFSYHGWFCTLDDATLRLGRRPAPAFVAVDLGDVGEALAAARDDLVPDRLSARVVSEVLGVEDGSERGDRDDSKRGARDGPDREIGDDSERQV